MIIPSLNTLGFPGWSLDQLSAFAQANQVHTIEIRGLEESLDLLTLPDFSTPDRAEAAAARLRAAGVAVISLNLGYNLSDDLAAQAPAISGYAALARRLNAPYLRFFSGGSPHERPNLDRIAENARFVLGLLAPWPVQMIVETHDALVRSDDVLALNRRLDGRLNLLWDIAHTHNYGGEAWSDTYAQLKPLIRYLHIKDTRREGQQIRNVPLFEGELNVLALLSYLAGQPEDWIVSFEWEKRWDPTLAPGDQAALDFLAKIRAL